LKNSVAHQTTTSFLSNKVENQILSQEEPEFSHLHFANLLRFMTANMRFTQFGT